MTFDHIPVPAQMVHKEHVDDVLIANMRSDLPIWISPEALASLQLAAEDYALLHAHYEPATLRDGQKAFVRRSVPVTLPKRAGEDAALGFVADYYTPTRSALWLDAKYLPERLEDRLAARFAPDAPRITPLVRSRLTAITDRLPCNLRSERQTFCMMNDLKNYYFYRKHHEHVPGIMLIEVARQAMYAQIYGGGRATRGDVTITIKSLNCTFDTYVDSNYPVTVTVETSALPDDVPDGPFEARVASFYQRGARVAAIDMVGLSISMKLFKRLRHSRPEPDDWFIPIKGFAPNVLFFGGDGRSFEGKLQQVSESAMDIVFAKQPDTDHPLNFIISIEGIGYVDGRVQPRALSAGTNGFVGRMDICDMSLDGKRKWCEAIKNYSHLAARPEQAA